MDERWEPGPGATRSRHRVFAKKIYFGVIKIALLSHRFQDKSAEMFSQRSGAP